ncbi:DUF642 domain-containing protein [Pseudomonas baetica]|uniref:DUF642 domain-containing protein n=1 Tax=Pseudomonas baetica TaxID=674054 RepID=UPI0024054EB3|nr:DUF642 domain-containing protein [Pseudomonas baetica]MDF9777185.1 hypothetical protein [Pseudomonas baetica]
MIEIKKHIAPLFLTAALLGSGGSAVAANLLVNGSFEQPGCSTTCVLDTTAQTNLITGWTTFLSGVEYLTPAAIAGSTGPDGTSMVDLANYVYRNGGGIQQNFATVVGARYRLTFSAGNSRYASRAGDGVVQVKVAGETVSFNTPVAQGVAIEWGTITYDFTATTPQTTLAFSNEQNPYGNYAFIDNVVVEAL